MAGSAKSTRRDRDAGETGPERCESVYGTTDWEAFFEEPPHGVIPLLAEARSRETARKVSVLVVDKLFTRQSDAERREAFMTLVDEVIAPDGEVQDLDRVKNRLARVFRHIKEDRQARAKAYQCECESAAEEAREERRAPQEELEFDEPPSPPPAPAEQSAASPEGSTETAEEAATQVFSRAFAQVVRERLDTFRAGMTSAAQARICGTVPFLLSAEFADHFAGIIERDIAPLVADKAKTIIRPAERLAPEEREAYFLEQINEYRNRRLLWEVWQLAWHEATRQQELPPKPKPEPKGGLGLLKKKQKTPAWKKQMTPEEWEQAAAEIRRANKRAKRVWAEITADSEAYDPPGEDDNHFLMELFGRSPKAIQEQMNALRQIASQGGEVGRAFDTFRKGKFPDAVLLAAAVRFPDLFLDGSKPVLKRMLSSFLPADLPQVMPYTVRYLGSYLA